MNALLAMAPAGAWGMQEWIIFAVVVAAVVGIVYAAFQYFGIPIPPILLKIVGIVAVAAFAIICIRFLFSL